MGGITSDLPGAIALTARTARLYVTQLQKQWQGLGEQLLHMQRLIDRQLPEPEPNTPQNPTPPPANAAPVASTVRPRPPAKIGAPPLPPRIEKPNEAIKALTSAKRKARRARPMIITMGPHTPTTPNTTIGNGGKQRPPVALGRYKRRRSRDPKALEHTLSLVATRGTVTAGIVARELHCSEKAAYSRLAKLVSSGVLQGPIGKRREFTPANVTPNSHTQPGG